MSEAGDVSDEEASFRRHDDHHNQYEPHAHPGPAHDVLNVLRVAELKRKRMFRINVELFQETFRFTVCTYGSKGFLEQEQRSGEADDEDGLGGKETEDDTLDAGRDHELRHTHHFLCFVS